MMVPTLRGYVTHLESSITMYCGKCGGLRILYRRINPKRRQQNFPTYCLKCRTMVVLCVSRVK